MASDTELRMMAFTDLLSTAIATAHNRAEIIASRTRLVAAADEVRRRITRDLHDAHSNASSHSLCACEPRLSIPRIWIPRDSLHAAVTDLFEINEEVRGIAHGIHPAVLSRAGLEAGKAHILVRLDTCLSDTPRAPTVACCTTRKVTRVCATATRPGEHFAVAQHVLTVTVHPPTQSRYRILTAGARP